MNPNLKWKVVFILAVIVLCIYFILGLPTFPTSLRAAQRQFHAPDQAGPRPAGRHAPDPSGAGAGSRRAGNRPDRRSPDHRSCAARISATTKCAASTTRTSSCATFLPTSSRNSAIWCTISSKATGNWAPRRAIRTPTLLTLRPSAIARNSGNHHDAVARNHRAPHQCSGPDRTHHSAARRARTTKFSCNSPVKAIPRAAKQVIQAGGQLELKLVEDPHAVSFGSGRARSRTAAFCLPGTELVQGTQRIAHAQIRRVRRSLVPVAAARRS